MRFCKEFNARTMEQKGMIIPVVITAYADRSFTFITKTPPAAVLVMKAAKVEKGSGEPNRTKVGSITMQQVEEIAKLKLPRSQRQRHGSRRQVHHGYRPQHGHRDQVRISTASVVLPFLASRIRQGDVGRPAFERIEQCPSGKNIVKGGEGLRPLPALLCRRSRGSPLGASFAKFDETVDVAIGLGVDPKYSDQMVRGAVSLPHGLGKTVRVAVFCKGEKEAEARAAGADIAGAEELVAKIKEGWLEFDAAVATPDVMALVGQVGRARPPRSDAQCQDRHRDLRRRHCR